MLILFIVFFVTSIWRLIGATLIDFSHNNYSDELHKYIGSTFGEYSSIMFIFFLIVLITIYVQFSSKNIQKRLIYMLNQKPKKLKIMNIQIEYILMFFLLILYLAVIIEIIIIDKYPLLDGFPRWQYPMGPISKYIFKYFIGFGAFLHGYLYIFFKYKQKCNKCVKIVVLLILLQEFIFIAQGNKFTTPLFTFLITISIISLSVLKNNNKTLINIKVLILILIVLFTFIFLMYIVFIIERNYDNGYLEYFLYHRIFIAPNQLNYDVFYRIFIEHNEHIVEAFNYLFINQLPMNANPSVNYLMYESLGPSVLTMQTGFTDAYPGISLELFGILGAFIFSVIMAILYVKSAYKMLYYIAKGNILESVFFFFLFQALTQYHNQGQFPTIFLFIKLFIVYILIQYKRNKLRSIKYV